MDMEEYEVQRDFSENTFWLMKRDSVQRVFMELFLYQIASSLSYTMYFSYDLACLKIVLEFLTHCGAQPSGPYYNFRVYIINEFTIYGIAFPQLLELFCL